MRLYIILLTLAWCPCLISAETEKIPLKYQIDGYREFGSLSKKSSVEKSMKLAESDFKNGIYRIFVYGKRRLDDPEGKYLQERYAIYTVPIAGCMVTDGILGAAEGYNQTMKTLLFNKFKKDVFEESRKNAVPVGPSNG